MTDKILFITDTHLGARGSSKIFREMFKQYYGEVLFPYIIENEIKTVIHAGDFFDNRSSITSNDIDFLMNWFIPEFQKTGADMHIVAGNHDVAYKNTNDITTLSLLALFNCFHIVKDTVDVIKTSGKNFVICPWINIENQDDIMEELAHYKNDDHILVGHFEIVGMSMYKNSKKCEHGFDPKTFSKFHKVLSGHFHSPSDYGNITYLGALFHYTWADYGDWRGFQVYDPSTNEFEKVENDYCLFTELSYHEDDVLEWDDEQLKACVQDQFVRVFISDEYNRVDLKELIYKIESFGPLSVDVIDDTITKDLLSGETEEDTDETSDKVKTVDNYVEEYLDGHKYNNELILLFNDIKQEAQQRIKDIE